MHQFLTRRLALLLLLALPAAAPAQSEYKLLIDQVRVGFPTTSREGGGFKAGAWSPVYVDVTNGPDRLSAADAVITVDAVDGDDIHTLFRMPLPPMEPNEQRTVVTYGRSGNTASDLKITIRDARGDSLAQPKNGSLLDAVDPKEVLYLTAGARLPRLRSAIMAAGKVNAGANAEENPNAPDRGPRHFAFADTVDSLPQRWFGYDGVDVMVLTTGNVDFVRGLLEDQQNRKEALAEWVRRGGRLVVSMGRNVQFANALLARLRLIDCTATGTYRRTTLRALRKWSGAQDSYTTQGRDGQPGEVEAVVFNPGPGAIVLESEPPDADRMDPERPVIVAAAAGLGRVYLVGVDVDVPPFTAWGGQGAFWRRVQLEMEPKIVQSSQGQVGFAVQSQELGSDLARTMEQFDDVQLISFAWVALFILLYILVVGPLDYFFLKRVVKRLELTWITFPAVVLVVSVAAYFTAYYLKGSELRINQVDVLDVDLHARQTHGTTWVTLFSPNIRNYTVGIAPPDGVAPVDSGAPADVTSVLVDWMARPEDGPGGIRRSGSPGFFSIPYEYAPDARGLINVPVQVWSTRLFQSDWLGPFEEATPAFEASLQLQPERGHVSGSITSRLPGDLREAVLIYRGKYYTLNDLPPGLPRIVDELGIGTRGQALDQWLNTPFVADARALNRSNDRRRNGETSIPLETYIKAILFHESSPVQQKGNGMLRRLDQGWRLQDRNVEEVIVCGRLVPPAAADPAEASSRLWLGQLPDAGKSPPGIAARFDRSTYVRVYIPVKQTP